MNDPKVEIIVPLYTGESEDAVETVTINGDVTIVPKGVPVAVERNVAEVLAGAYNFSLEDAPVEVSEDEEAVPEEAQVTPLSKQNRQQLDETAKEAGIESPEDFDTKADLIEAIEEAEEDEE